MRARKRGHNTMIDSGSCRSGVPATIPHVQRDPPPWPRARRQILPRPWHNLVFDRRPTIGSALRLVGHWSSPSPSGGSTGSSRPTVFGEGTLPNALTSRDRRGPPQAAITMLNKLSGLSQVRGGKHTQRPVRAPALPYYRTAPALPYYRTTPAGRA
jgi:hypothetical protein